MIAEHLANKLRVEFENSHTLTSSSFQNLLTLNSPTILRQVILPSHHNCIPYLRTLNSLNTALTDSFPGISFALFLATN